MCRIKIHFPRGLLQLDTFFDMKELPSCFQTSVGLVQCQACGCGEMGEGRLSLSLRLNLFGLAPCWQMQEKEI